MRLIAVCVLAAAVGVSAQAPQPSPPATGAISGVVTDGETGAALSGVFVQVQGLPRKVTDASGRFIFTGLPAGDAYIVSTASAGYLDGGYGRRPGDPLPGRVSLKDGEWRTDINVRMWRTASLSGSLIDDRGEAIVEGPVQLLRRAIVGRAARWAYVASTQTDDRGAWRFGELPPGDYLVHAPHIALTVPADAAAVGTPARTTSVGGTTSSALVPAPTPPVIRGEDGVGSTLFGAIGDGSSGRAFAGAFYPSARRIEDGTVLTLKAGERRAGIDVQLLLVSTVRVTGRLVGPADTVTRMTVRLVPSGDTALVAGTDAALTQTNAEGVFTFDAVPEGDYLLIAGRTASYLAAQLASSVRRWLPANVNSGFINQSAGNGVMLSTHTMSGPDGVGTLPVSVGREPIADLMVPIQPATTVSGTLQLDTPGPVAGEGPLVPAVRLEPVDLSPFGGPRISALERPKAVTAETLPFTVTNVLPGRYMLAGLIGTQFGIARAEWNGRDLLNAPLEVEPGTPVTGVTITLTRATTTLTGTVVHADGTPAEDAVVLVFPEARALWPYAAAASLRFRTTGADTRGQWRMTGLPPGEYLAIAVPAADRIRLGDDRFIEAAARQATAARLTAGATVTVTVRLTGDQR